MAALNQVPLRTPFLIVDNFLPAELAKMMRQQIDSHFADPHSHLAEMHQIWNYWSVPEYCNYLRTNPEKIIGLQRVETFVSALKLWSLSLLGMGAVTWPNLRLYVSGCREVWHNDAASGRFSFVYSLTTDERCSTGGETLIFHEGDPFRRNLKKKAAGRDFYEVIEPRFNRLLVFDSRLAHSVERVDGAINLSEGCFLLHGYLIEADASIAGPLPVDVVAAPVNEALRSFTSEVAAQLALYHGPLSLRISIGRSGSVQSCTALLDRVVHTNAGDAEWGSLLAQLIDRINNLRFPVADGETMIIQPIIFGSPVRPDLELLVH